MICIYVVTLSHSSWNNLLRCLLKCQTTSTDNLSNYPIRFDALSHQNCMQIFFHANFIRIKTFSSSQWIFINYLISFQWNSCNLTFIMNYFLVISTRFICLFRFHKVFVVPKLDCTSMMRLNGDGWKVMKTTPFMVNKMCMKLHQTNEINEYYVCLFKLFCHFQNGFEKQRGEPELTVYCDSERSLAMMTKMKCSVEIHLISNTSNSENDIYLRITTLQSFHFNFVSIVLFHCSF